MTRVRDPAISTREQFEMAAVRRLAKLPPRVQVRLSGRPAVCRDGATLDPATQLFLAAREWSGAPPLHTLSVAAARHQWHTEGVLAGRRVPVGSVRTLTVNGADGPRAARHYVPHEPTGASPAPLLVFLHGGGWVTCDLDTHDSPCRLLCRHGGVHVLSVDYRLAPEHPFPCGLKDALAALVWAQEHAGELGADPQRIAIGGDSAGGNLAAVAARLAVEGGRPPPALQLLIYPATDFTRVSRSRQVFGQGFFLTQADMEWFADRYVGAAERADPRLSPLLGEAVSGLPPALVFTGGFDPLRDEGEAYAAAMRVAGTRVLTRRFPGLVHGFLNATALSPANHEAVLEMAGALRAGLHTV